MFEQQVRAQFEEAARRKAEEQAREAAEAMAKRNFEVEVQARAAAEVHARAAAEDAARKRLEEDLQAAQKMAAEKEAQETAAMKELEEMVKRKVMQEFKIRRLRTQGPSDDKEASELLLGILGVPEFDDMDMKYIKSLEAKINGGDQILAELLIVNEQFRDWLGHPTSRSILIHGRMKVENSRISAISLFCSSLVQDLRAEEQFRAVVFFCGLHLSADDPYAGALGLIKSFISQLLHQDELSLKVSLEEVDLNLIQGNNIGELCRLFSILARQLTQDVTLFCIIDGIHFFERDAFSDDVRMTVASLLALVSDLTLPAKVKVLITSPTRTEEVRKAFSHDSILSLQRDPQVQYFTNLEGMLLQGTGEWVLSRKEYISWLADPDKSTLWIHGKPGTGKTMLSASLIQQLRSRNQADGAAPARRSVLAHFFCATGATQLSDATTILASLIHQIIVQVPELIKHPRALSDNHGDKSTLSGYPLLWETLRAISNDNQLESLYFLIDGLEQCDEDSLKALLDPLDHKLGDKGSAVLGGFHVKAKWILVSRNYPAVSTRLVGVPSIDVNTGSDDLVRDFVRNSMKSLNLDDNVRNLTIDTICDKANGSLLWASFAVAELKKEPETSLGILLQKLPLGLGSMYSRVMEKLLKKEDVELTRCVLTLLAVSCAPLPLDALDIISAKFESLSIDQANINSRLIHACGDLVHVSEDENTILPLHVSLKDYLASSAALFAGTETGDLGREHGLISERCLQHVCKAFGGGNVKVCDYAVTHWMDHGRQSSQTLKDVQSLIETNAEFFKNNSKSKAQWLTAYWRIRYGVGSPAPSNFTMIHMAAESGYAQLAEVLLKNGHDGDLEAEDGSGRPPLYWAAFHGHCGVAEVLIKAKADIEARVGDLSILQVAIKKGHKDMVQLLLKAGARSEMEIQGSGAPSDIAQLLLERVNLRKGPSKHGDVDRKFWGVVVDVWKDQTCSSHNVPVGELIGLDRSMDDIVSDGRRSKLMKGKEVARWIHIPANNASALPGSCSELDGHRANRTADDLD
jgi:hypothetical protein